MKHLMKPFAFICLPMFIHANTWAEQDPALRAKEVTRQQKIIEERIAAFNADPQGMVLYVEDGGINVALAVYRDGRFEYIGTPRLRSLPERFDVFNRKLPASRVKDLEAEFAKRKFLALDYLERQRFQAGPGATLTYRDVSGASKAFSINGDKRPPREIYELIEQLFLYVDLKSLSCSDVSKGARCDERYRQLRLH